MTVVFPRKLLVDRANLLERVVPSKNPNPLLTHVGLRWNPPWLTLYGTNTEADLEAHFPALEGGARAFEVLLPGGPFFAVLKSLPGETVGLEVGGEGLTLESGSFKTRLGTADPTGYPELGFSEEEALEKTELKAEALARALSRVRYAVSGEEYRGVFRGVQLEFGPEGFRAVASDGYRLALQDLPEAQPFARKVVLPGRGVDEVLRLLKALPGEDPIRLALGPFGLGLSWSGEEGGVRLVLRLMEGSFPDYERVIPKGFVLKVEVEAPRLREAIRRVSILADAKSHRLDLALEGGRILLSAEGDYGRGQEEVEARLEGSPLSLSFNARYLLEALGPIEEEAVLEFSGPTAPTLVRPLEASDGYRAVVVPLRV